MTGGPKRVNVEDGLNEYWFECRDCEGTGRVTIPDPDTEPEVDVNGTLLYRHSVEGTCPDCDGAGYYEGEADDLGA